MPEQVRWGILGNANIARTCVLPAMQKSRNGTVRSLGTRNPAAAQALAGKHGIASVVKGYEALLADPAIDAVYIPLPNHLHCEWTLKALAAGKHVLCEKPLACNAGEARLMADAAEKAGLLLMEAFMYRFHPRTRRIKELVSQGAIGEPRLVHTSFCFSMDSDTLADAANPRLRPDTGGGALLDVGCYGVSVARYFFGCEPERVQGQAVCNASGADMLFAGTLLFSGGGLATVEAGFMAALQQTYTITGSRGSIELPHDAFIPWEHDAPFTLRGEHDESGILHSVAGADEYRLMVEHFSDAVLGREPLACSPLDSIGNMQVLDGLARSARDGMSACLQGA
jgi:D-xylose 1-dehydrogenase (NADP+, D-xylono-1,5-lactone-forming)